MSTIKNGKYGDAEASRLATYDHPEYNASSAAAQSPNPALRGGSPAKQTRFGKDRASFLDNEAAGYSRPVGDDD
jgi:hypothetical protein